VVACFSSFVYCVSSSLVFCFFCFLLRRPLFSTLFPYTTLFRSFLSFLHLDEWYTLLYFLSSLSRAASYALCLSLFMCVCCPQYCLSNGMSALHAGALQRFNGFMLVTPHAVVRFHQSFKHHRFFYQFIQRQCLQVLYI